MAQSGRPTTLTGDWSGAASDLADESDATYIQSPADPTSGEVFSGQLPALVDPGVDSGHVFRLKGGWFGSAYNVTMQLINRGDQSVAGEASAAFNESTGEYVLTLPAGTRAAIDDYAALDYKGWATQTPLLSVHPTNTRYLATATGAAVFLSGSNYWNIMQDGGRTNPPPAFDFDAFVSFLSARGLNYCKAHVWEQCWHQSAGDDWYIAPTIYSRPGPGTALDGGAKFDLDSFNADYFNRLRARIITLGQAGVYVVVSIFDRFSVKDGNTMTDVWSGHPYHASNNINSINGDPDSNGHGLDVQTLYIPAITAYQEAYVEHLIDALNDLDNVLWEIAMEPWGGWESAGSDTVAAWVDYFIAHVATYEATKAKQHPILQGVFYPSATGDNAYLMACGADVISPNAGGSDYDHDCPYLDGTKVVLVDTDHILWTETDVADWAWKSFLRGAGGFALMDGGYSTYDDQGGGATFNDAENGRYNMGVIVDYAAEVDLANMAPQNGGTSPCSTGYCLQKTGEYLCLSDNNGSAFTLNLTGDAGTFDLEWFRLSDYSKSSGGTMSGNGNRTLTPPSASYHVAYLKVQ